MGCGLRVFFERFSITVHFEEIEHVEIMFIIAQDDDLLSPVGFGSRRKVLLEQRPQLVPLSKLGPRHDPLRVDGLDLN